MQFKLTTKVFQSTSEGFAFERPDIHRSSMLRDFNFCIKMNNANNVFSPDLQITFKCS